MSRLQFRATVEAPRPAAAWLMVSTAGATLSITGQLAPWALAAAYTAIFYSWWFRLAPKTWQRSTVFLNFAVISIGVASVSVSLQGNAASVALAHFALLTQGLQLLDARPRKSEFLLVALALFQVVLAANLTDSVIFVPMLILFLASTTWTLMVHTLRSEAIEASDQTQTTGVLTAGLGRATLVASFFSILLALVIFTMLPRFRSSMIERNGAGPQAVSGFTDEVRLGTIGQIRKDTAVFLRVETLEGTPPRAGLGYWRGLSFDHFDGQRWSVTPPMRTAPGGSPTFGIDLARAPARDPLVQRIVREPVTGGVLFGTGEARRVNGSIKRVELDVNGSLYSPTDQSRRIRYTIRTETHEPEDTELRGDRSIPPRARPEAYLELPTLVPEVKSLARRITSKHTRDADRVRAIENYLRNEGSYTDSPREMDPALGKSPVEGFLLGELSGHCEYFASGMVVLARSVGIPSRLVNGFAGGQKNEMGDFVEVTRADAHAWVEVHYEDAGWVRYDPTPPSLRTRVDLPPNLASRVADFASMMELWWYQRVVDFDTSDQVEMIRATWTAWRSFRDTSSSPEIVKIERDGSGKLQVQASADVLLMLGLLVALVFALMRLRIGSRQQQRLPPSYARALNLLRRRGLPRKRSVTARDYARQVEARVPEASARAFNALTEAYLAERFGNVTTTGDRAHYEMLRRELPRKLHSAGSKNQSAP